MIGIYFGLMQQYNVIDFIEWSLIKEWTIFLECIIYVARISLLEICKECRKNFLMIMTSFHRPGYSLLRFLIFVNSLKVYKKTKRKHLSSSQKLLAKVVEYFWLEISKIWTPTDITLCSVICTSLILSTIWSLIWGCMFLYVV